MRFKNLLIILTIIATASTVKAQDFHFTQFDMSPLTLNPALTGAYEGTFRIGGIYRDQWASVIDNPFRTPSFYIDAPLFNVGKGGWIGAGVSVLSDRVGVYNYQNTLLGGSVAYHYANSKMAISVGAQANNVQRRADFTLLQMEDAFVPGTGQFSGISSDAAALNDNVSFLDINAGVNVGAQINSTTRINVGVAAAHLTNPTDGFQGGQELPTRITAHAKADIDLNQKLVLSPALLFQTMGGAQEINAVAMIGYKVNPNFMIQYGQGWRVGDATNAIVALQYDRFKAGISYDINISDLNNISNYQGGFEVAFSYIARIYKEPKSDPVIFCPRF